ncbi:MAG: sodium:proton antiporter [Candidatus Diapherotrites archaeon]|nr:sodium:proton antiporter [Candidatus Diapherotrites archaeon]
MMSRIVRDVSRLTFPLFAMFGFYLVAHGHLTPGGGFQGGAIIASSIAMIMVAYGIYGLKEKLLSISELAGLFSFLILVYFGSHFAHSAVEEWFKLPVVGPNAGHLISAGVIPLMSIAVGFEVACGISIIVIAMRKGD